MQGQHQIKKTNKKVVFADKRGKYFGAIIAFKNSERYTICTKESG